MCDYSLESRLSRPAVVGEKLITHNFGAGTSGFASVDDKAEYSADKVAVCLLPGTELAFDQPVVTTEWYQYVENAVWAGDARFHPARSIEHKVARFAKINAEHQYRHHDGLEFPDQVGVVPVLLTHLVAGQLATVLQMPADLVAAKAADEATRDHGYIKVEYGAPSRELVD